MRDAWTRLPRWARGPVAYGLLAGSASLLGLATPLGVGGAFFLAGGLLVLASTFLIRLGGERYEVTLRAPDGRPLRREPVEADRRRREIRRGLFLFLLGLALWAPVVVEAYLL